MVVEKAIRWTNLSKKEPKKVRNCGGH